MKISILLIGFLSTVSYINCYVLLQVRKDKNNSNVDAIIHKVVPSSKFNEIANKLARKRFNNKRFELKTGGNEAFEDVLFVIDTGAKEIKPKVSKKSQFSKRLERAVSEFANSPSFRSKVKEDEMNPELIHFRNEKPSLLFEMNSEIILKKMYEFLSSKRAAKYANELANKAAVVYRSVMN